MQKIKDWSPHIIRHFWYCSSACRKDETTTDEEALRLIKVKYLLIIPRNAQTQGWLLLPQDYVHPVYLFVCKQSSEQIFMKVC